MVNLLRVCSISIHIYMYLNQYMCLGISPTKAVPMDIFSALYTPHEKAINVEKNINCHCLSSRWAKTTGLMCEVHLHVRLTWEITRGHGSGMNTLDQSVIQWQCLHNWWIRLGALTKFLHWQPAISILRNRTQHFEKAALKKFMKE